MYAMPVEHRRGHWIPELKLQLSAVMSVLGTEPRSSARAPCAFNH